MNRLQKLLLVILSVVFLTWLDQHYTQYKYDKKIIDTINKPVNDKPFYRQPN